MYNDPNSDQTVPGSYSQFPPPPPHFHSGPGQFGPPPPKQGFWRRQSTGRKIAIGFGAILGVPLLCLCSLAAVGFAVGPQKSAPVAKPTAAPRMAVRAEPTKKPTVLTKPIQHVPTATQVTAPTSPLTPTSGPLQLGEPVSNFVGAYGQPMDTKTQQSGMYDFQRGIITVFAYPRDNYRVSSILYDNTDANGWANIDEAAPACRAYIPGDSTYQRTIDITGPNPATERVYFSASLASLIDASEFYDENGNITTRGTFGIVYNDDSANSQRIINCSVQIGLQGN